MTTTTCWDDWDITADTWTPANTATAILGSSETRWTIDEVIRYGHTSDNTPIVDAYFTSPTGTRRRHQIAAWAIYARPTAR